MLVSSQGLQLTSKPNQSPVLGIEASVFHVLSLQPTTELLPSLLPRVWNKQSDMLCVGTDSLYFGGDACPTIDTTEKSLSVVGWKRAHFMPQKAFRDSCPQRFQRFLTQRRKKALKTHSEDTQISFSSQAFLPPEHYFLVSRATRVTSTSCMFPPPWSQAVCPFLHGS